MKTLHSHSYMKFSWVVSRSIWIPIRTSDRTSSYRISSVCCAFRKCIWVKRWRTVNAYKPFVNVSNSYRKYLWWLSQTAFAPRVSWLLALCEACSTLRSGLGDSTADTLEQHIYSSGAFIWGNLSSPGYVQLGYVPGWKKDQKILLLAKF